MTTYTDTFGKLGKKNVSHSTVVDDRTHDFAMENLRDNENVLEIVFVCSYWAHAEYFKQHFFSSKSRDTVPDDLHDDPLATDGS